ncbi:hypothetical protein C450_08227 [Halococcus salifodinae DSM 8989]|uniref:Uncharacterized protein n=1 Tax=Halococcus salifodinae DSM 8989 TaxID=1227456 RepID=M0N5X8_9EURY|nr:hypothetical protein C450_08227 [Halococcus salifodinae DSM 8989]
MLADDSFHGDVVVQCSSNDDGNYRRRGVSVECGANDTGESPAIAGGGRSSRGSAVESILVIADTERVSSPATGGSVADGNR